MIFEDADRMVGEGEETGESEEAGLEAGWEVGTEEGGRWKVCLGGRGGAGGGGTE